MSQIETVWLILKRRRVEGFSIITAGDDEVFQSETGESLRATWALKGIPRTMDTVVKPLTTECWDGPYGGNKGSWGARDEEVVRWMSVEMELWKVDHASCGQNVGR